MTNMPSMAATDRRTIRKKRRAPRMYDFWLLVAFFSIIVIGLVMVASASIVISEKQFNEPFYFLYHQIAYLIVGFILCYFVIKFNSDIWRKAAGWFLLVSYILLALVLVHGIGREVNGSMRWIGFGPIGMQVSELAKAFSIIYLADYLVRRQLEVRTKLIGFIKPMALFALMAVLLLKEPDFGAATVILTTAMGMLFLAEVPLGLFIVLFGAGILIMAVVAVSSPYRVARLTTFLNPWANQYASGYQLTQSLIAFGRGGLWGVGLGSSIQKYFYLPEAHTDFLLAVLAEELGFIGVLAVLALFTLLVARIFVCARRNQKLDKMFAAYYCYGVGLWIAIQTMINVGVNAGLLPTKGLTLPLMSYGGSSIIVMCVVIAIVLRMDYEARILQQREKYRINRSV